MGVQNSKGGQKILKMSLRNVYGLFDIKKNVFENDFHVKIDYSCDIFESWINLNRLSKAIRENP